MPGLQKKVESRQLNIPPGRVGQVESRILNEEGVESGRVSVHHLGGNTSMSAKVSKSLGCSQH